MIKCDFGGVTIKGPKILLQAELGTLIRCFISKKIIDAELLDKLVELAKDDDFDKSINEDDIRKEIHEELESFLDELFDGGEED